MALPLAAAAWIATLSVLAFALTVLDKVRARRGAWRIRERTLLGLALLGGSPGLLFGMLTVRHKTRKGPFLWRLLLILLAQGALVVAMLRIAA